LEHLGFGAHLGHFFFEAGGAGAVLESSPLAEGLDDGAEEPPADDAEDGGDEEDGEDVGPLILGEDQVEVTFDLELPVEGDDDEEVERGDAEDGRLGPELELFPEGFHVPVG